MTEEEKGLNNWATELLMTVTNTITDCMDRKLNVLPDTASVTFIYGDTMVEFTISFLAPDQEKEG